MSIRSRSFPLPVLSRMAVILVISVMAALAFHGTANAQLATNQITGIDDTTSTPVPGVPHDYITGLNEIVNPANGSLSVRIKAPTPGERGVNWPLYTYSYDSDNTYTIVPYKWFVPSTGGGDLQTLYLEPAISPGTNGYTVTEQTPVPTGMNTSVTDVCQVTSGGVFTDLDGGRHPLGVEVAVPVSGGTDPCGHNQAENILVGGDSQYKAVMNPTTLGVTIIDHHGNLVGYEDVNGNQRSGTTTQTGRQETVTSGTNTETFTLPGVSGNYILAGTTTTATAGSISIPYDIVYQEKGACQFGSIPLEPSGYGQQGGNPGISFTTSQTLTLPNGQEYQFTYDPTSHMLQKIVYPTNAYVEYTWQLLPDQVGAEYLSPDESAACGIKYGWYAITQREVSFDGSQIDEVQNFTYTTIWPATGTYTSDQWTSKTTKVTTIDKKTGQSFDTIYTYSPVTPPPTSVPFQAAQDRGVIPQEKTIQYYNDTTDSQASLLKTTTKTWQTDTLMSGECETLPNGSTSGTFYVYQPYSGFGTTGGQPLNGDALWTDLPTDAAEYDYGQVTIPCVRPSSSVIPLRETETTYQSFANTPLFPYASLLDRPSKVQVYGNVGGTQTLEEETDYVYDGTALASVSGNIVNHDSAYGTSNTVRGNPTQITRVCTVQSSAPCSYTNSVSNYTYDIAGQLVASKDPNGNTTNYTYSDSAIAGDNSPGVPSGYVTDFFLSAITEPPVGSTTFQQTFTWGYNDGRMWSKIDENGQKTNFCYWTNGCKGTSFDPFFRLTEADYPDSGYQSVYYNDATPSVKVTTAITTGTGAVTEIKETVYQAMGQNPVETQLQSDPVAIRKVYTYYDGLNRVSQVSTPYWSASDPTYGLTTYAYDALNRTISLKHPDNTSQTWQYNTETAAINGDVALFTDEKGNQWQRTSDALGRLTQVLEPSGTSQTPTNETDYAYDEVGNLTGVTQWGGPRGTSGSQTRSFVYNGLSELRTSNNPENGTITYTYDANGNVLTKTGSVKITYGPYDSHNRPAGKSYSDGLTPPVTYTYDTSSISGSQYTKTRLTSATVTSGSNVISQVSPYNYDSMGRVQDIQVCVPTSATACANKLLTYSYNKAGNVASMTDNAVSPALTITSTYDGADQLSLVTSNSTSGPPTLFQANSTSSTAPSYGPVGLMNASLGVSSSGTATATINRSYDNRVQVTGETDMEGSNTVYSYSIAPYNRSNPSASGYDAVGNVVSVSDLVMGTWDYGYDTLNRISSANAVAGGYSSATMSWTIDAFGNRTAQNVSGNPSQPMPQSWSATISSTHDNRIVLSNAGNWTYDATGDVTSDGVNNYLYDGEARICAVKSVTTGAITGYLYDGNGDRIAKGTLTTFSCNLASNGFALSDSYVVDKDGEQLTEFQGTNPVHTNVFTDNGLLATYSNSETYFAFSDWLGSKRVVIGTNCNSTYASLAYGDELTPNGNCIDATEHHYTGKERDVESSNDYFGARYYASIMGRFTSPDWSASPDPVPNADIDDPQSLNLYAYVENSPVSAVDPDGHCEFGYEDTHCNSESLNADFRADLAAEGAAGTGESVEQQSEDFWGQFDDRMGLSGNLMSQVPTILGVQQGPFGNDNPTTFDPLIIQNFQAAQAAAPDVGLVLGGAGTVIGLGVGCLVVEPCGAIVGTVGTGLAIGVGVYQYKEHSKGATKAKEPKHQKGQARKKGDLYGRKDPPRNNPRPDWWPTGVNWPPSRIAWKKYGGGQ